jgi:hypothetical protein
VTWGEIGGKIASPRKIFSEEFQKLPKSAATVSSDATTQRGVSDDDVGPAIDSLLKAVEQADVPFKLADDKPVPEHTEDPDDVPFMRTCTRASAERRSPSRASGPVPGKPSNAELQTMTAVGKPRASSTFAIPCSCALNGWPDQTHKKAAVPSSRSSNSIMDVLLQVFDIESLPGEM